MNERLSRDGERKRIVDAHFMGDDEIFQTVARSYVARQSELIRSLDAAIESGDSKRIEFIAHKFKGEVGLFHLGEPAELLALIEAEAHFGRSERLLSHAEALKQQTVRLTKELLEMIESLRLREGA